MRTSATPRPERHSPRRPASGRVPRLALEVQYAARRAGLPAPATLRRWAGAALERDVAATLRFVGLAEGRTLNALYRGKEYPTNVLTFVYDDAVPLAGDIVLCVPVVRHEARTGGRTLRAHCAHLVVHGMLHLQGHDHATPREAARMEARETALLAALGYADPYAETRAAPDPERRRPPPRRSPSGGKRTKFAAEGSHPRLAAPRRSPPPAGRGAPSRESGKPGGG